MIHIKIVTPMYQGDCSGYYTEGILALANECRKYNIMLSWQFLYNESIIARGRNTLVHTALQSDVTHILFIDADMKFRAEDIIGMLEADKDVIAAVCPKKEINWNLVRQAVKEDEQFLERRTGNFNFVPLQQGEFQISQYEPLEVMRAGTGIMLIKREVFEKLKPTVKTFKHTDGSDVSEYFKMEIDDTGLFIGEDYYFCNLYKQQGGKIFVAPWTEVGHYGPMLYQGTLF